MNNNKKKDLNRCLLTVNVNRNSLILLNNDVRSIATSNRSFDLNKNNNNNNNIKSANDLDRRASYRKEKEESRNDFNNNNNNNNNKKRKFSNKTKFFASVCLIGLTSWMLGKIYVLNTELDEHVSVLNNICDDVTKIFKVKCVISFI
jgi:hypothetical protein